MKTKFIFGLSILLVLMVSGQAQADSRIKTKSYGESRVYSLTGHFGFQMAIEFNDDEVVENVAIGDSVSWQVTPNRRGNVIILKPISKAPPTNMTVVTSLRHYFFELNAKNAADARPGEMVYVLRFTYPRSDAEKLEAAHEVNLAAVVEETPEDRAVNRNYSYQGSREIVPSQLFDDGRSTYFKWAEGAPTPAIFLVGKDDKESVINHGFEAGYIVVDRVAEIFSLKHGEFETQIYNDSFQPIDPGPDAPRPRSKKRGFFSKVFGDGDDEGDD